MVISAVMMALALVLPIAFHAVGLGSKFLPMLLPLLLNGFLVPLRWAVFIAVLAPFISCFATGMPPLYPPSVLVVALEGAALAGVASAVYRNRPSRRWPALLAAIAAGRITAVAATWFVARIFNLPPGLSAAALLLQGLPGVALQLVVVPLVLAQLSRRRGTLFQA
jgi:putative effector of murein hydrolase